MMWTVFDLFFDQITTLNKSVIIGLLIFSVILINRKHIFVYYWVLVLNRNFRFFIKTLFIFFLKTTCFCSLQYLIILFNFFSIEYAFAIRRSGLNRQLFLCSSSLCRNEILFELINYARAFACGSSSGDLAVLFKAFFCFKKTWICIYLFRATSFVRIIFVWLI